MKLYFVAILSLSLLCTEASGQTVVERPFTGAAVPDTLLATRLVGALDSLFRGIQAGHIPAGLISDSTGLSRNVWRGRAAMGKNVKVRLINYYPLAREKYWLTLHCTSGDTLVKLISLVASDNKHSFSFQLPLRYLTRHWKTRRVGNVTYYFDNEINVERAKAFNKNGSIIAAKLGHPADTLNFYMTDNYQQALELMGFAYERSSAGQTRDGCFADGHTIFAIMHNEDFSHDLVHYDVSKVRTNSRNTVAEEGLAYYWGNAYYTDPDGNMIGLDAMAKALKAYFAGHNDAVPLDLFRNNPHLFPELAKEVAVRSVISALFFREIERTKGVDGVMQLINCGKGDEHYFAALKKLTGIDTSNFNNKVKALLR